MEEPEDTRPALKDERFEEMTEFILNDPRKDGDITCWVIRDRETGRQYIINQKGGIWELTQ
jgi:hypothetical protein